MDEEGREGVAWTMTRLSTTQLRMKISRTSQSFNYFVINLHNVILAHDGASTGFL